MLQTRKPLRRLRRPRRMQPYTQAWERAANELAREAAPVIYPCGACGGPVLTGYCCTRCGCEDPERGDP